MAGVRVLLYAVNRTTLVVDSRKVCIDNILVDESGELHLIDFEGTRVLLYVTRVPHVELKNPTSKHKAAEL